MNPPTTTQFGSPFELEIPPPPQPVIPGLFPGPRMGCIHPQALAPQFAGLARIRPGSSDEDYPTPPHIPLMQEWIEPEPESAPATPQRKKRKSSK